MDSHHYISPAMKFFLLDITYEPQWDQQAWMLPFAKYWYFHMEVTVSIS